MLHINLDKSCFMHFSNSSNSNTLNEKNENDISHTGRNKSKVSNNKLDRNLVIGDSQIPEVDSVKFLGVTFDKGLSWVKQTENLYKRLKCAIAVMKRIKPCITKENFKTLYYTLFESHLLYGISVWGGISHRRLEKILDYRKNVFAYSLETLISSWTNLARVQERGRMKVKF